MSESAPDSGGPAIVATRRARVTEASLVVLATVGLIYALVFARDVLVPFLLAIIFATVLRPAVRRLERVRVPAALASLTVVLVTLAILLGVMLSLERPLQTMAADVPRSVATARAKLNELSSRLRRLTGTGGAAGASAPARPDTTHPGRADTGGASSIPSGGVTGARGDSGSAPNAGAATGEAAAGGEKIGSPGPDGGGGPLTMIARALGVTTALLLELVEEILLLYFLLAAGDGWLNKLKQIARSPERQQRWMAIAGEMHDVVARYLLVNVLINAGQGILIGLAAWWLGLPSPPLWAALTFVAEFFPYLGGLTMLGLLFVAGVSRDQGFAHAVLGPAIYLVVTTLQNNLVSPMAYGKGLRLNPTVILVGVMFWWLLWGIAGAFLAVPLLAAMRVLGKHVKAMEPVAVLLEE